MASDKAREIEAEAVAKTRRKDWSGARDSFLKVLEQDDLLPSDRAYTLVNNANTYQGENNHSEAIGISRQALEIAESLEHSDRALRAHIVRTIVRSGGSVNFTESRLYTYLSLLCGALVGIFVDYYAGYSNSSNTSYSDRITFLLLATSFAAIPICYMSYVESGGMNAVTFFAAKYFGRHCMIGFILSSGFVLLTSYINWGYK